VDSILFENGYFSIGEYAVKAREVEVNGYLVTLQGKGNSGKPHIFDVETFTDKQYSGNAGSWQIVIHDKDGKVINLSELEQNWENPKNQLAFLKEYTALGCVFEVSSCTGGAPWWESGYTYLELRERFYAAISDIYATTQNNGVTHSNSGEPIQSEINLPKLLEAHRTALRKNRTDFLTASRNVENEFNVEDKPEYDWSKYVDDAVLQAEYRKATKTILATMDTAGMSSSLEPSINNYRHAFEWLADMNVLGSKEITVVVPACPSADLLCLNFYLRFIWNLSAPNSFKLVSSLAEDPESGWVKLDEGKAKYHQNHIGLPEIKYVNTTTGQEVVFDGDTHEVITDVRIAGTYNYVTTTEYISWGSIGHFFNDMLPYYMYGVTPGDDDLYGERTTDGYKAIVSYADLVMNGRLNSQDKEDVQKKNEALEAFASKSMQIAFGFVGEVVIVEDGDLKWINNYEPGRSKVVGVSDPVKYFKELSTTFAEIAKLDILDSYRSDVASSKANRKSYLSGALGIVLNFQQSHPDPMLQHPLFMLLQNIGMQLDFVESRPANRVTLQSLNADKYNQGSQIETKARSQALADADFDISARESQAEIEAYIQEQDETNDVNAASGECVKDDESGEDC
jgi:hypothetical protein